MSKQKRRRAPIEPLESETELQALFDNTAFEPSAEQLARTARAAVAIPDQAHGWSHWLTGWLPTPQRRLVLGLAGATAIAAGAAIYLGAPDGAGKPVAESPPLQQLPRPYRSVVAALPPAVSLGREALPSESDMGEVDDGIDDVAWLGTDSLAALDPAPIEPDPVAALGLLYGPPEGADVQAWSEIYDQLLEDPG